jgi:dethiobiotin synthetase
VSVFVTGTDTGVGKTTFTVWLLWHLRARGLHVAGYKPICCGDRDDAMQLMAASSPGLTIDDVNPVWLRTPAAPLTASIAEGREIDRAALGSGFVRLKERFDFVAVEGVGGWKVPITTDYFTSDLAAELRLPVVLIARNRLGCLNHVFLTLQGIEGAGMKCAGIVLNDLALDEEIATATNAEILRRCLTLPILAPFDRDNAATAASLGQMLPEIGQVL